MVKIPDQKIFTEYKKNHTIKETAQYFQLSRHMMEKLLILFEIRKHHIKQRKECPLCLTAEQEQVITGNLLGDGSLSKLTDKSKNSLFEIKQKADKSEYIKIILNLYKPFSKSYKEGISFRKGKILFWCRMRTISHPVFTTLRNKWYKDNLKVIPNDIKLRWRTLAFWACDDGSNWDGRIFRLHTNCFSFQEVEFILEKIKTDIGITGSVNNIKGKPVIVFCGDNAFNIMEGIKEFVPNCYKYKTLNRLSKYRSRNT
jgi:hypothetical protein